MKELTCLRGIRTRDLRVIDRDAIHLITILGNFWIDYQATRQPTRQPARLPGKTTGKTTRDKLPGKINDSGELPTKEKVLF